MQDVASEANACATLFDLGLGRDYKHENEQQSFHIGGSYQEPLNESPVGGVKDFKPMFPLFY